MERYRLRQRLLEAAVDLLAAPGRDALTSGTLLTQAAAKADCSLERAQVFFRRDEELILALYLRLATELEERVEALPQGTVAVRFAAAVRCKLELITPYREALTALMAYALDPRHELGALSERTELVRSRVMTVFEAVVRGATDAPPPEATEVIDALTQGLYGAHLALLLLWTQDRSPDQTATETALGLAESLLTLTGYAFPGLRTLPDDVAPLRDAFAPLVAPPPDPQISATAEAVLRALFRHRRLLPDAGECAINPCPACRALHLPRVRRAVLNNEPIHLLLPAFPAKSPSRRKTLGPLPDRAETRALSYLQGVCDEITTVYPPGVRLTICSDGRVFSDLVGVSEEDVTAYGDALRARLFPPLDHFALEDVLETGDFTRMRDLLVAHYAEPLDRLRARAEESPSQRSLVNGIHRFLFEEFGDLDTGLSRTQLRNWCQTRAYEVIQRSDAWGRLIAECFPTALRLSIHPQAAHSAKIGILLGDPPAEGDLWLTPWHAAAVYYRKTDRWSLQKRDQAEQLPGARIVQDGADGDYIEVDA